MKTIKEKEANTFTTLKEKLGYKNTMQAPKLVKVVLSIGTGKMTDKKRKEFVATQLTKIAGQKASVKAAKKSIATFKLRQGDSVGLQVTLRGARMRDFLEKLIHVALPRTRDFRGLKATAIDAMGNMTIGIKEHNIFPETAEDDIKDVFGLAITVVTTSKKKEDTKAFLEYLGFPFAK
ncbi:MAG TPA: 50S ribosomal protein L5 [Candidatus Paceibacterota bacterium]|nr:50S ribosomal protein L5 [Candidatus Paceibacterota bacterium]